MRSRRFSGQTQLLQVENGGGKTLLKKGISEGPGVGQIQIFLSDLFVVQMPKTFKGGIKPDGVFGSETEAVVKRFQKLSGLMEDGIVGPKTLAAMDAMLVAKPHLDSFDHAVFVARRATDSGLPARLRGYYYE